MDQYQALSSLDRIKHINVLSKALGVIISHSLQVPEETCNLEPQRHCKHVTKLVPKLKPSEECVDVPTEACSRTRTNPRKVRKPVVKKWCYVPTAQSGLA